MREVTTPDGRVLAVEEFGRPDGTPVIYLHGTPMSRLARHPSIDRFAVRLITYDRPGFGNSTSNPGRRVADAAEDVATIADALGLARFPVFGVSGGGPHALAVAALAPDRVTKVAALASLAPIDAEGLDWTAGMMAPNVASAQAAALGREALFTHLTAAVEEGLSVLPAIDQAVLARPEVNAMIRPAFAEAIRPGVGGWADDELALFGLPWGFDPRDVTAPVRLWHGELDEAVPVAHGRWLAARIDHARLETNPSAGHAGHFDATPPILEWLVKV